MHGTVAQEHSVWACWAQQELEALILALFVHFFTHWGVLIIDVNFCRENICIQFLLYSSGTSNLYMVQEALWNIYFILFWLGFLVYLFVGLSTGLQSVSTVFLINYIYLLVIFGHLRSANRNCDILTHYHSLGWCVDLLASSSDPTVMEQHYFNIESCFWPLVECVSNINCLKALFWVSTNTPRKVTKKSPKPLIC